MNRDGSLSQWLAPLVASILVFLLAAAAAGAASECAGDRFASAPGDEDGIGGTGLVGEDDGIGGTGLLGDEGDEDGIGGTGVFGTITGFASICINGLEVAYRPDVSVSLDGTPASAADLAVGQVVWVVASVQEGRLTADSISVLHLLAGRVDAVDRGARRLVIAGETVEAAAGSVVLDQRLADAGEPLRTRVGTWVIVSGLRRPDGLIVASRVDRSRQQQWSVRVGLEDLVAASPGLARLSVEGYLAPRPATGAVAVAGLAVDASSLSADTSEGARVRVEGRLDGGTLRAVTLTPLPDPPMDPPDVGLESFERGALTPRAVPGAGDTGGRTKPGIPSDPRPGTGRVPPFEPPVIDPNPSLPIDPTPTIEIRPPADPVGVLDGAIVR